MADELRTGQEEKQPFRIKRFKGWFFPYNTFINTFYPLPDGSRIEFSFFVDKHGFVLSQKLVDINKTEDVENSERNDSHG